MISTLITRASAGVLALGGLALLFASDAIVPRLIPGFPASGAWLGQLLGAAWLGVAALNWASQPAMLGGIYGRPVVLTNAALYFIAATVMLKVVVRGDGRAVLWAITILLTLFAAIYTWLLFRGPFERDFQSQAR
jgi:hypothetical protein